MPFKIKSAHYFKSFVHAGAIPENNYPQIAFAGRSNVGKSSLLNTLANKRNLAKISSTPGKTRLLNFFLINDKIYFVDLPGYGYAKTSKSTQRSWKGLIEGYLESSNNLKGVVQIIDIRHPAFESDLQLLEWLDFYHKESLVVLTKADKLSRSNALLNQKKTAQQLRKEINSLVIFSAKTGEGKDKVLKWISSVIETQRV
jgi:GTP-binding protein